MPMMQFVVKSLVLFCQVFDVVDSVQFRPAGNLRQIAPCDGDGIPASMPAKDDSYALQRTDSCHDLGALMRSMESDEGEIPGVPIEGSRSRCRCFRLPSSGWWRSLPGRGYRACFGERGEHAKTQQQKDFEKFIIGR